MLYGYRHLDRHVEQYCLRYVVEGAIGYFTKTCIRLTTCLALNNPWLLAGLQTVECD